MIKSKCTLCGTEDDVSEYILISASKLVILCPSCANDVDAITLEEYNKRATILSNEVWNGGSHEI